MSRAPRKRTQHWADLVLAEFAPSREQIIAERLQQIEVELPQLEELADLIREARGLPPQLSKPERIEAERLRLEAMTLAEMRAERAAEVAHVRELVQEAEAYSKTTLERARVEAAIEAECPNGQQAHMSNSFDALMRPITSCTWCAPRIAELGPYPVVHPGRSGAEPLGHRDGTGQP